MINRSPIRRALLLLLLLLFAPGALGGCRSFFVVKGKVIEGDVSIVAVVPASDPRMAGPGLDNAFIRLETDPHRINREIAGEAVSGANGNFEIPFRRVGGNLLMYDVGVTGRRQGFMPAMLNTRVPPSDKRILIILTPGPDGWVDPYADSPSEQVKRFR